MNVILLEKVGKLGNIGDQVSVKAGYGRNFLIPQGKAVPATETNVAEFEARRADLEAAAAEKKAAAEARAAQLVELTVTITAKAGARAGAGHGCRRACPGVPADPKFRAWLLKSAWESRCAFAAAQ